MDEQAQRIEALRERVEKGIEWLVAHDQHGAFHHWYTAGISPLSPMPAQEQDVRDAYREYHRQRDRWEELSRTLGRIDPEWGPS